MPLVTKKGQVTIPKELRDALNVREGDSVLFKLKEGQVVLKKEERKSILSLGGIAKGRKIGAGSEREYAKQKVSERLAKEGAKNG